MNDRFEVNFFGGQQWKAGGQIETQLRAEHAERSSAGAVAFAGTVVKHVLHQV